MNTLEYIFDPLCGWCYGAAPLVQVAREVPGLQIRLHAGGLMSGMNRKKISAQWRSFVVAHDQRIARMSGQPFGEAYQKGLLFDETAVMDSTPPISAILAAERWHLGLALLDRLQRAHFVEGRRICDDEVRLELGPQVGIDAQSFAAVFREMQGEPTMQHITASREFLSEVGGSGFPTFAVARGNGWKMLEQGGYVGRPEAWRAMLAAT